MKDYYVHQTYEGVWEVVYNPEHGDLRIVGTFPDKQEADLHAYLMNERP